jgi:DNA-binding response OmpR family regulator
LVKRPSPDRLETIRILHVDDEPGLLQITKLYLIEANPAFVVESLSTSNKVMERLEEPFDCVVSDYQMPGMDGIELSRRIKEKHDIPFIIYTGRGSEEVASIAFEAGADDYIRKELEPSHYQVLARRIEEAVRKHRVERELQRSESRYRNLVELTPFVIMTFDFKGFLTSVNRTLLDLTGFSRARSSGSISRSSDISVRGTS